MPSPPTPDVFAALLQAASLPEAEASKRLDQARDPAYWRGLTSAVTILDANPSLRSEPVTATELLAAQTSLRDDGIFRLPAIVAADSLAAINGALDAVVAAGWPPAFAFVYDQPWLCARLPAILALATSVLGEGCKQIPHVWTHIVQPHPGASGWPPHMDGPAEARLSVWLALTDATLDNGCMYVVPRAAAPRDLAKRPNKLQGLTSAEASAMLQGTRALPASAGAALGWAFDVLHWGGRAVSIGPERRSVSLEFIAADQVPTADERPLVALNGPLPRFGERLMAIATAIFEYRKFELPMARYKDFASALLHIAVTLDDQ